MDRVNYHHLYLFWTLSREGTFTKTADRLSIAQSAVTSQVKSLEGVLGLNLIDRTNRRKPILTDDGKAVLQFANSIFETGDELLKWAKGGTLHQQQVLRVGALSGLSRNFQFEFLKPMMGQSDVQLEVTTGDQEKLVRLLKEHHLDLILSSHNVPADGRVTWHSTVLTSSPLIFVVQKKNQIKGADLKDYIAKVPLYVPGRTFETRPEIDAFLDGVKVKPNIAGEIDDIALLRIFALKSKALVAIPKMGVLTEVESGEVHIVAQPKGLEQKFYVISRQKRNRNRLADLLMSNWKEAK